MLVRSNGAEDFKALAAKLRRAGPQGRVLRRNLTARLNAALDPVVRDVQDAIRHVEVKGSHGGGARARRRFAAAAELRRASKAEAAGKKTRRRRHAPGTGLREHIAAGIKRRVQYSGFRYGAQITAGTSQLPQSQRTLPAHLDDPKGWRHPVFGNREVWVRQQGRPWFAVTISRHVERLRREVKAAVDDTLRELR